MAEDLSQQISDAASNPSQVTVDGNTTISQRIPDLIAADQYLAAKAAAKSKKRGLLFSRFQPPGTVH